MSPDNSTENSGTVNASSGSQNKSKTDTPNRIPSKENADFKGEFDVIREDEDTTIKINYEDSYTIPSIEESSLCMSRVIEILSQVKNATKIVFIQRRDYEYDYNQTRILQEIADLYTKLTKEKTISNLGHVKASDANFSKFFNQRYSELQKVVFDMMKKDPIGTYVELYRIRRREKIQFDSTLNKFTKEAIKRYMDILTHIIEELEKTRLIIISKPYLQGHKIGDRDIYRHIFYPNVKPDFMHTKLMASLPREGIELDSYTVRGDVEISIFEIPGSVQYLYHVTPPEFRLEEEEYELLDTARTILSEHKPEKNDFINPKRMREVFTNVGVDLLNELADHRNLDLTQEKILELAEILVRYTIGYGLVEVLLQDEQIQDISVNSPLGHIPIFIVHAEFGDCITNIMPTRNEAESWATKLRLSSGRPLDEANQILDTELELPGASIRVSAITEPLDPSGLAFSFRRHRDRPWTLPLFMKQGMITDLAAGLISFLVDGTRSMLICGTRSSGKSSFLSAVMIEIMRRYRIITIEDTLELPTNSMRKLGFNIQPLKVASALAKGSNEMPAEDGIRSTLRLGDSALIVGEVRSGEAKALYEAMRVGAAANVVAGTIHGDSPYGIYDRVVNDIGVPKTSFKATDICIIANPIKSADGIHKKRRITQITEVRKDWDDDPQTEKAFIDLMKYNAVTDKIEPTEDLLNGNSDILKMIAGNISDFVGNWDAVWDNIELRAKCKKMQLEKSIEIGDDEMIEAEFTIKCNDMFHKKAEEVKKELGVMDSKEIYLRWENWLEKEIRIRKKILEAETKEERLKRQEEEEANPDKIQEQIYGGGDLE